MGKAVQLARNRMGSGWLCLARRLSVPFPAASIWCLLSPLTPSYLNDHHVVPHNSPTVFCPGHTTPPSTSAPVLWAEKADGRKT